jgi:hypothetical protein
MGTVVIGKVISGDSVFLDDDEQPFLTGGACLLDGIFVWLLVFCITDGDYVYRKETMPHASDSSAHQEEAN